MLAVDVDLGGLLPASADGLVGDPRVVRGHLQRLVVQQNPDDLLGDVAVDQPAGEGVAPLVWGEPGGLAVLVADVAVGEPTVEHRAVAVVGQGALAVGVARDRWEQVWVGLRPAVRDALLLGADVGFEFLIDRDGRLAAHLVVEVAQVGGALAVVDEAVEREGARI